VASRWPSRLSGPGVRSLLLSGQNAGDTSGKRAGMVRTSVPLAASQILAVWSKLPVARCRPSGENPAAQTAWSWPSRLETGPNHNFSLFSGLLAFPAQARLVVEAFPTAHGQPPCPVSCSGLPAQARPGGSRNRPCGIIAATHGIARPMLADGAGQGTDPIGAGAAAAVRDPPWDGVLLSEANGRNQQAEGEQKCFPRLPA